MQFPGQGKPPVGILFDSDMGSSIDGALALALLYGFDGKNEARVISVSVSRANLSSAAFCEAVGRFYAGAVNGGFGGVGRTLPVGLADYGKEREETPMLSVPLAKMTPDGKPLYAHGIHKLNDTAEVPALIRNAFTSQYDQNSIAILAGPATNYAKALDVAGFKELAARKCRFLAMTGGAFPDGRPEYNIQTDIPAARKLFAEWPTPIVVSGSEIGEALAFPAASIERDFAWSPAHPVVDAYKAYRPMPYDAPSGDMSAVLYAVHSQEGYFKLSEPGTITVLDDGRTKFTPSAQGKHRYLILDPAQKDRIIKIYTEIASAKPVPRVPRFRLKELKEKEEKEKLLKEKEIPVPPSEVKPPAAP
ncbi:MAG: nucleoside hydrolase [Bryobacteraceae bacterium]